MAASKATNKSTSKKKPASAPKKKAPAKKPAASSAARSSPPPAPQPVRREVWGVVFLFLAVFMVISHFNTDGAFIAFFSNYLKGLVGYGFWVVPPAFVLCTYILFTHKGKPVDGRISCALLLPIFFSAVMELGTELTPTDGLKFMDMVGKLFWTGQDLISGGVLGGLLAKGLEAAFSIYGAMPVLILLFLACLILAIRGSFKGIFSAVRIERQPYDPAAYAEPEKFTVPELRDARGVPVGKAPKPIERVNRGTYDVDLPLGEDEEPLMRSRRASGSFPSSRSPPQRRSARSPSRPRSRIRRRKRSLGMQWRRRPRPSRKPSARRDRPASMNSRRLSCCRAARARRSTRAMR